MRRKADVSVIEAVAGRLQIVLSLFATYPALAFFPYYDIIFPMSYKNIKNNSVIFLAALLAAAGSVGTVHFIGQPAITGPLKSIIEKKPVDTHLVMKLTERPVHATGSALSARFFTEAKTLALQLRTQHTVVPPAAILAAALRNREEMLRQSLSVHFEADDRTTQTWTVALKDHPAWLMLSHSLLSASFDIDPEQIEEELRTRPPVTAPADGRAGNVRQAGKVLRADITGIAQEGYRFDIPAAAGLIAKALTGKQESVRVAVQKDGGSMILTTENGQVLRLALLSTGQSNFAHSPEARAWNVNKALQEKVSGVVVPPHTRYSFNDTLDTPITNKKGWKDALGLFGGGAAMTPGGGICQVATTTYRAALFAGLPIIKRKAHSMYVSYYELGGVGMDATIFPGSQDLVFDNDTDGPLVFQAWAEGDEARVRIYGVPDGRQVAMEGPYFNTTPKRPSNLRALASNEIAWIQKIKTSEGTDVSKPLIATYFKGIPRRLKTDYALTTSVQTVHAAAPLVVAGGAEPCMGPNGWKVCE